MNTQGDTFLDFNPQPGDQQPQFQPASEVAQPTVALTIDEVDAIAREADELPRVERFDVKAQLARLGPTLASMKLKGYDLAWTRNWLSQRGIDASISSISRALSGGDTAKPKSKKRKIAK